MSKVPKVKCGVGQFSDAEAEAFLNYLYQKRKEKTILDYLFERRRKTLAELVAEAYILWQRQKEFGK